jgi:hypothetical protein
MERAQTLLILQLTHNHFHSERLYRAISVKLSCAKFTTVNSVLGSPRRQVKWGVKDNCYVPQVFYPFLKLKYLSNIYKLWETS